MRAILLYTLLLTGFLIPGLASAQWVARASTPSPRGAPCSCTLGGMVYMFGGGAGTPVGTADRYDPATNTWTALAPMSPRSYCGAAAGANGKIYVIGGYSGVASTTVQEYDPATNTWTNKTPMLGGRYAHGETAIGNKIYVYGGWNGANMNSCHEYDILTDSWSVKASFVQARYQISGSELGGLIYAVGGYVAATVGTTDAYDPVANTWTSRTPMTGPRYLHGVATYNGMILGIGGYSGGALATVEGYSPATNTWSAQPGIGTARYQTTATNTANCVYSLAGLNFAGAPMGTNQEMCTILPYEGIQLIAENNKGEVTLNWFDNEAAPGQYNIEISGDGIGFEFATQLGSSGAGGYEQALSGNTGQVSWFRIRKTHFDGSELYSNVAEVQPYVEGAHFNALSVEPGEYLWLEMEGVTGPYVDFDIMDVSGRSISTYHMDSPPPGKFVIAVPLPVSSGVYLVMMNTAYTRVTKKIGF